MNFQCKSFLKCLAIVLLVLIFEGCISLAPPYQQVRYSNDPNLSILKEAMTKEEAVQLLRTYVVDQAESNRYFSVVGASVTTISEKTIRKNTIVNEDSISFDMGSDIALDDGFRITRAMNEPKTSSFVLRFKDVKKIKLYTYKEIIGSYYKVYLYDQSDKPIFPFSFRCNDVGKQEVNKLLAALSVLIPQAQEEYNEGDTKRYTNPMPFFN